MIKEIGLKCYEADDFSEDSEAYNRLMGEYIDFVLIADGERFDKEINEAEEMKTPWFLPSIIYDNHKETLLDEIRVNGYLYDAEGNMLDITYLVNEKNEVYETDFMDCPVTLVTV